MNKARLSRVLAFVVMAFLGACGSPTRIQVENKGATATKVTVRTADGSFRHDFAELAPGQTTVEIEADLDDHRGINVDASDNHENGTVDLQPGVLNLIQIHEDGIEPQVTPIEE